MPLPTLSPAARLRGPRVMAIRHDLRCEQRASSGLSSTSVSSGSSMTILTPRETRGAQVGRWRWGWQGREQGEESDGGKGWEREGWGPGPPCPTLKSFHRFPFRAFLCAWAGCHSWLMKLVMVASWRWRWVPYACNDLSYWGTQEGSLCHLLFVLLKCLWAPSLGRVSQRNEVLSDSP